MKQLKLLLIALVFFSSSVMAQKSQKNAVKEKPKNDIVMNTILQRKSVRAYTDQQVTKEDLTILLKAAMAAPTARNSQPWLFVVLTEPEVIRRLSEASPINEQVFQQAKAAIVVCGDETKFLKGEGRDYWIQDCSAATENILIQAEAMGLGAVWTGVYPIRERVEGIRRALRLPKEVIPLNIIPLGWQTGTEKPKDKFDEKNIHWNRF